MSAEAQPMTQPLPAVDARIEDHPDVPPRVRGRMWMIRLASMLTVIGAWEVVGRQTSSLFLSYPTAIFTAATVMIGSGE